MDNFFLVAEISSVYNKDGFVSAKVFSDFPERFFNLKNVFVDLFGGLRKLFIEEIEMSGNEILMKFKNFDSQKDVEPLVGNKVYIKSEQSVKLEKDIFFIHDLIGCEILFKNEFFGTLIDVMQFPANDVYVIIDSGGNEVLIPAVKDYIEKIDIVKRRIILIKNLEYFEDDEN
ncbi:MAG: ribosome maturation factor RimM [Bacteroidetes bacterium]|nr:ribosome maturation factor RimM [Bacteroidota bacterium]MBU1679362.1 ribosome maturation factor RimM [Bacteroidota bacterium]MBU2507614.1 ribosome maturation factor RimM [Bacteroidota bacterium]